MSLGVGGRNTGTPTRVSAPAKEREGGLVTAATHAGSSALRRSRLPEARRASDDDALIECIDRTLVVLHGKWKVQLLFLMARGVHRHGGLLERLPGLSKKVMTESLRALERDGLVARSRAAHVPRRVEYSLTALGWTMTEPLIVLSDWGAIHGRDVSDARRRYGKER